MQDNKGYDSVSSQEILTNTNKSVTQKKSKTRQVCNVQVKLDCCRDLKQQSLQQGSGSLFRDGNLAGGVCLWGWHLLSVLTGL